MVDEFLGMVSGLPDNKAAGFSGITNKLWKHYNKSVLDLLLVLLNSLSMISKPYNWERVLINTQPIALIETAHKILSKILSNKIFVACSKFNVLRSDNFSVFKGTTMQSPIFAIGSVVENALEKNHKLWLVLQNMRKVYYLIGWKHLRKSLVKIKMCNRFIRFFGSIHNGCMNKVITNFGLTDEVFSPLLWCIFYNTLLCEVKKQEVLCDYRLNLHYDSLTSFLATRAFVDNIIWVGSNQMATQHIFNIASEFFRINDISINNDKTVVIPINYRVVAPFLSICGAPISITKKETSHQYLGIFLFSDGLSKPSLAKVHLDVQFFANLVLRKAISDKQFSYLVSAVFHLIVGYRTQFSFISASVCQNLKLKSGLPLDFPNDVLHHFLFYGLKTFEQIQTKGKVAAVVCFANSVGCPVHPLCFPICISVNPLNNFLVGVVQIFLSSGLSLGNLMCNVFHFWYGTFLSGVFGESMYFRCLSFFHYYGIAFVEQLWCHDRAKRLDPHGLVLVWFVAAVQHLHDFGSLDVCSSLLNSAAAKNILESHEFRMVHDRLSSIGVFGFSVYTDSSLSSLKSVNMKAGTTAFFEDINLGLGVEVTGMVSSILAELQAIVLALKCVPSLSSVCLFSNSQAVLDICRAELLLLALNFWNKCWVKEHLGVTGNIRTDLLTDISSHLGQPLPFLAQEISIVSENSKYFVYNVFRSIHCVCWELGSGIKIVNSYLFVNVDWFRSFLVWHSDSYMAAGFTNHHSANFCSYFMKALHHRLPIAVRKHLYDKHYPSVMCLYCGDIEVSDHLQLFVDFAFAWRAVSGLSHALSHVSQMLSDCLTDLGLVVSLYKSFVLVNWYQKATSCFGDSKTASDKVIEFVRAFMEKHNLISHNNSVLVSVSGGVLTLSAHVIRLLGINDVFGVSFGLHSSCQFFSDIGNLVSVYVSV
ncbi:hypothetical protein G9A89_007208 [Geosiphon pyriformis]|nr:hypothetical protein G9A89_007208 [Geosiphon pyriformis]